MAYRSFIESRALLLSGQRLFYRGAIKNGVLLGFWQGNKLKDAKGYLKKGDTKKVFYKIFQKLEDTDAIAITEFLYEVLVLDQSFKW